MQLTAHVFKGRPLSCETGKFRQMTNASKLASDSAAADGQIRWAALTSGGVVLGRDSRVSL